MRNLRHSIAARSAYALLFFVVSLSPESNAQTQTGIVVPYDLDVKLTGGAVIDQRTIDGPEGTTFLRVFFESLMLGANDRLELRDANGKLLQEITDRSARPGSWSVIVYALPARLTLLGGGAGSGPGYRVSQLNLGGVGFPTSKAVGAAPCGPDCDSANVECFNPGPKFANSRSVARFHFVVGTTSFVCTAWIIGSPDCIITNWHCIDGAAVGSMLAEFDYECDACVGGVCKDPTSFAINAVLGFNSKDDWALLDAVGNPAALFGFLSVNTLKPVECTPCYIIHHSSGLKKGIDHGVYTAVGPGVCDVGRGAPACEAFYNTNTSGGASGSPVFCEETHLVEVLHHCGYGSCSSGIGVPMANIAPAVQQLMDSHGCAYDFQQKSCEIQGDNFIHLINGVDYFFGKTPPAGSLAGIWRCIPGKMLHAPTIDVEPTSPTAGTYATKVRSLHATMTASPGSTIDFPTIALTSSPGSCDFLASSGTVNYGLFALSGFGTFVGGPLNGPGGPVSVNLLAGVAGFSVPNPAAAANTLVQLAIDLTGPFGSAIGVPEGDSLVCWFQDDPNQFGAGTLQYWTGSLDERNLCSGYSFLLSAGGTTAFRFVPAFEWSVGLGTVDATLTTAIRSVSGGPSGLNAHDGGLGFSPGFDQGTGTRTISVTGGSLGSEFLGLAVYDTASGAGGFRVGVANIMGFEPSHSPTCSRSSSTFITLPTGGPGGPLLSATIPEMPRSVGKFDTLSLALLSNGLWFASTNHRTSPGSMNLPWFPSPAGNSGSNATGVDGGFVIPLPPLPSFPGLQLYFWSLALDPTNTFLDPTFKHGHVLTNGYDVLFFP